MNVVAFLMVSLFFVAVNGVCAVLIWAALAAGQEIAPNWVDEWYVGGTLAFGALAIGLWLTKQFMCLVSKSSSQIRRALRR